MDVLIKNMDPNNLYNSDTLIGSDFRDGIGLGMSKDKMLKFKFGHFAILGIICSNNIEKE